ncbi:hypothetical protein BKA65DRAFT_598236 [Rhexocercosporidium sp. MPI-PUGE-AT-0058]|nr:hypothetical protein BKA65DRAFT_598236 [Rhexocercosporidium sp. MPI-PUGE-AT-0058]
MPTDQPLPIRLAQTLGITTSLLLAGSTLSTSLTTIPRLLESPPTLLLQQWGHMYDVGRKTGPPVACVASVSFFWLAWRARLESGVRAVSDVVGTRGRGRVWIYSIAGILSIGIIPYTFAVIMGTNRKLLRKVEVTRLVELSREDLLEQKDSERSAHQLVDWWGVLNLGRGVMLAVSGGLGVWAALG